MTSGTEFVDGPGVIVVADASDSAGVPATAIAHAGARLLGVVAWADALARIADQAAPPILAVETAGIDEAVVARLLPALAAAAGPARTIVAFEEARLDEIGGALIGTEAIPLCAPTVADRIAALILVMAADTETVREDSGEATRLARINQEVARFAETLARLTGTGTDPDGPPARDPMVGDRRGDFGYSGAEVVITAAEVRRAIRARRLRDEVFGLPGLFEDPAWDMLLDLFAADLERRPVSVSSLCIAAAVAPTTALRWINKLIEVGLFERRPDAFDRRRAFVALTARASAALRDYVTALGRAGLAIA